MELNSVRFGLLLFLALITVVVITIFNAKSFSKNNKNDVLEQQQAHWSIKPKEGAAALGPVSSKDTIRVTPTTTAPSVSPSTSDSPIITTDSNSRSPSPRTESSSSSSQRTYDNKNSRRSCMNRVFYDKLPALIDRLNSDPNGLALQPLLLEYTTVNDGTTTTTTTAIQEHVDGFNVTALHGRRMVLLGDSTLFYPHKFLYQVMVQQHDQWQNLTSLPNITLNDANKLLWEQEPWMNFSSNIRSVARYSPPPPIVNNNTTLIEWAGMSGLIKTGQESEEKLADMHAAVRRIRPHIIVVNMGLHWLQVCAFSMTQCPTSVATVERVVYYEESWLQSMIDTALEVNASLVLFKTTNYVNVSSRTGMMGPGAWAKWDRRLQRFRAKDINNCMAYVYELLRNEAAAANVNSIVNASAQGRQKGNLTNAQIKEYCMYSQYTEVGAKHLNGRLQAFVEDYNNSNRSTALAVGIFNDHDLEINAHTTDGIHHPFIALLRLRLLINTIQSYDECIGIPREMSN